jgi:integrase
VNHLGEENMKGVYQRGQVWWVRYRFNGKYVHQAVGRDRVLAERTMEEIRRRIQDGRHEIKLKDERRTFAEMAEEYLEAKSNKRSLRCDRSMLRHLVPVFGPSLVHAITRAEVEAYARARRKEVSGATVNRALALLRCLFNVAIERGYCRDNPVRGIKKCKEAPWRRKYVYGEDELQALVDAAAPHLRPILAVAVGTGLRKGDILGLRWNDVDFGHGVITLYMQKTEEGIEVPMLPMVREVLWRLKATAGESPLVFAWEGKRIVDVRRAFHTALRRSGLAAKGYHFHDLRRTFATMLYNRGVLLTKIQRLLGHRSVTTTERYLGIKFEETVEAIAVLDSPALNALAGPQVGTKRVQLPAHVLEVPSLSVS